MPGGDVDHDKRGAMTSQLVDCNCSKDTLFINLRGIRCQTHTAGVPRREALVIGLDRLDDEGVGNALAAPLPLIDEEAVRAWGATAAASGGTPGCLCHGI